MLVFSLRRSISIIAFYKKNYFQLVKHIISQSLFWHSVDAIASFDNSKTRGPVNYHLISEQFISTKPGYI